MYRFLYINCALFIIYLLKNILYPSGAISTSAVFLISLFGFICCISECCKKNRNLILIVFALFWLMNVISYVISPKIVYGVFFEAIGRKETLPQLVNITMFIMPFYTGYFYGKAKGVPRDMLVYFSIAILIVSVFRYIAYGEQRAIEHDISEGYTNNVGYLFVCMVPVLPIIYTRNRIISLLMLLIVITFVIISSKRGAILTLIAALFAFFLYFQISKKTSMSRKITIVLFTITIFLVIYYLIMSNDFLQVRFERQKQLGFGGREIAYSILWNHWITDNNPYTFLFGNGMMQSITVWGNYAHNDWLELLIDNGLIGGLLYAILFLSFFVYIFKCKTEFMLKASMILSVSMWFLISFFSMGYTSVIKSLLPLFLGILIGNSDRFAIIRYKVRSR